MRSHRKVSGRGRKEVEKSKVREAEEGGEVQKSRKVEEGGREVWESGRVMGKSSERSVKKSFQVRKEVAKSEKSVEATRKDG